HDGRARSLLEAILWHGGEALSHRNRVIEMPAEDRAALIKFLESL
ncbi:MAG: di-heme oxidoredictase family protein, partial [Pseudomonadota bacterium]